ncbi:MULTISPECIES: MmgE/PrpD family protein [Bradyrhizobium]|uniref:MmgE/PrpD family protein n=1 Tax=Bradyrhizobium TaxID=374 RepID=UPI0003FB721C|nr:MULTISPECIES: MmgE/PrpD family protein [Bradyrhizobium]UFW51320.1 MmgE/PrpD family protein [Bradyrhizobium arachidis]
MSDLATDLTGALARFFSNLDLCDVPTNVKAEGRRLLLDSIGCMIAATHTRMAPITHGLADFLGDGNLASVVGRKQRTSLAGALYANGRLANCMDFDDTFPVAHHFGAGAVVAALALAEARKSTGAQLLQALIAGYELGGRVASACGQIIFFKDGRVVGYPKLYSCATPVVFAAAGAAIRLECQDEDLARETFGIAGSNAPLPAAKKWSGSVDLPDCKYADVGWATLVGVFAARSAALGATGFAGMFDGDQNVIKMSGTDRFDPDLLIGGLGSRWMLADITYKPWPTCRWTHQALTALSKATAKVQIDPEQIQRITIGTNGYTSTPRFCNPVPRTFCSRQFSIPHAVAMLLLGVAVGPEWLDEAQDDNPKVRALRDKVFVEEWDHANTFGSHLVREQTRNMPARVAILMRDGTRLEAESDFALGDPWTTETAWGDEQVIEKFRVASGLSTERANAVIEATLNIEAQPDVELIVSVLREL